MSRKQQQKKTGKTIPYTSQDSSSSSGTILPRQCSLLLFYIAQDTWKTLGLMTLKRSCHVGLLPKLSRFFLQLPSDMTCLTSKALFSADKCQLE